MYISILFDMTSTFGKKRNNFKINRKGGRLKNKTKSGRSSALSEDLAGLFLSADVVVHSCLCPDLYHVSIAVSRLNILLQGCFLVHPHPGALDPSRPHLG